MNLSEVQCSVWKYSYDQFNVVKSNLVKNRAAALQYVISSPAEKTVSCAEVSTRPRAPEPSRCFKVLDSS